jgi:hypothetical protein
VQRSLRRCNLIWQRETLVIDETLQNEPFATGHEISDCQRIDSHRSHLTHQEKKKNNRKRKRKKRIENDKTISKLNKNKSMNGKKNRTNLSMSSSGVEAFSNNSVGSI